MYVTVINTTVYMQVKSLHPHRSVRDLCGLNEMAATSGYSIIQGKVHQANGPITASKV